MKIFTHVLKNDNILVKLEKFIKLGEEGKCTQLYYIEYNRDIM